MAVAGDWRAKYQDLVREFDAAELRWRDLEHILRRIIARLCVAADGADERLDRSLDALARASRADGRNSPDADQWSRLFGELDTSVNAVRRGARGALAPGAPAMPTPVVVAAAARWQASIAAIANLLRQLAAEFDGEAGPEETIESLQQELQAVATDAALASVIQQAAELVAARADRLAHERREAAGFLERVTERLEEISAYLGGAQAERRSLLADAENLTTTVTMQVRELSAEVCASDDLGAVKRSVGTRLEAISTEVGEYRQREQQRHNAYQQHAAQMSMRLAQLEQQAQELQHTLNEERRRARIDMLTGVANRAAFDERFAQEVARCAGGRGRVSVLFWDLDHFKAINDRFGHRVGDGVLREVARCLVREVRAADFVARLGGEEFATLLIDATVEQALKRAEELRGAVAALKLHVRGTPLHVTVSCGATEIRPGDTPETLFDRADAALYQAKKSGRNLCTAA